MAIEKFWTKCGKKFVATGREVICPSCKATAAEEARHAAVLRAKRASWAGESVPVRISGRASTVIRAYGKANNMTFAAALDDLLKASDYFKGVGQKWESIEPYKSRRMKKSDGEQEAPQEVKTAQAAKVTSKSKTASKPQEQEQEQEWMRQIKKAVLASKTSSKSKTASKEKK